MKGALSSAGDGISTSCRKLFVSYQSVEVSLMREEECMVRELQLDEIPAPQFGCVELRWSRGVCCTLSSSL